MAFSSLPDAFLSLVLVLTVLDSSLVQEHWLFDLQGVIIVHSDAFCIFGASGDACNWLLQRIDLHFARSETIVFFDPRFNKAQP